MIEKEQSDKIIVDLTEKGDKDGYIKYADILNSLGEERTNEEAIDYIVTELENRNYVIKEDDDLLIDEDIDAALSKNDVLDDDEPDDAELALEQAEEESEIKMTDFDNTETTPYQTDDIVKMYLHEIGQIELLTVTQEIEYARMVQEGLMCKERKENAEKQGKKIKPEELEELNNKIAQGKEAQDILTESNLRLVVNSAKRYINRGLPLDDLIQEGNLGLMKAVLKFDPTRGFKFSTYATWWIKQAINRAIADKGRNIRIPVHMVESVNRLTRVRRKLTQELHREPTSEELAKEMGISYEKIVELQRVTQDSVSFDSNVGDEDDSTLMDLVADNETLNPLQFTEKRLYNETIDQVIQTLTPREEMVIRLRYGIGTDRDHTLEEVGKIMGVTRERVRQIEAKALERLRKHQRLSKIEEHRI